MDTCQKCKTNKIFSKIYSLCGTCLQDVFSDEVSKENEAIRKECSKILERNLQEGDNHGRKRINGGGYIDIYIRNKGWMREHRYIMEQSIGRELTAEETVHHRNGIRDDNRLENLELWASAHPPGQRIEDQIQWAKELLAEYEPESLK